MGELRALAAPGDLTPRHHDSRQVRICRSDHIQHLRQELVAFNEWLEATPERLLELRIVVETGNDLFGAGTHWLEHRTLQADQVLPDQAVLAVAMKSLQAWHAGDLADQMQAFTEGAVLVTPTGGCHFGRGGLRRAMEGARALMPGLKIQIHFSQISYPCAAMATLVLRGELQHDGMQRPARWSSLQSQVNEQGSWLIAGVQLFIEGQEWWPPYLLSQGADAPGIF